MFKLLKWGMIGCVAVALAGGFFFGRELFSYAKSTHKVLQTSIKDQIPVTFEIQRARDLLEELMPEMHANLRAVAQEEVEVAQLEKEVKVDRTQLASARTQIQKDRQNLTTLTSAGATSEREKETLEEINSRFERFRTSELLLSGKEKLLSNRRKSLEAAIQKLEKTRIARVELSAQIEGLEGQFRLVQAQGASSDLRIDTSKLAQTQKLLSDLRKRLEISQRILERESSLLDPSTAHTVSPEALAEEMDRHLGRSASHEAAEAPSPRARAGI